MKNNKPKTNKSDVDVIVEELENDLNIRGLSKYLWNHLPGESHDEEILIRLMSIKFEVIATSILKKLKENRKEIIIQLPPLPESEVIKILQARIIELEKEINRMIKDFEIRRQNNNNKGGDRG